MKKKSVKLCLVHDFKSTKLALFMIHIRIVGLFLMLTQKGQFFSPHFSATHIMFPWQSGHTCTTILRTSSQCILLESVA